MSNVTCVRHCRILLATYMLLGFAWNSNAQTAETTSPQIIVAIDGLNPYQYADLAKSLDTDQVSILQACVPIGLVRLEVYPGMTTAEGFAYVRSVLAESTGLNNALLRDDLDAAAFDEQCLNARRGQ